MGKRKLWCGRLMRNKLSHCSGLTRLIIRGLHLNYKVKAMAHLHGLVVNATEITLVTEALVTVII